MTIARTQDSDRERYQRYLCSREWAILKEAVRDASGPSEYDR